jgi:hypothetical protein
MENGRSRKNTKMSLGERSEAISLSLPLGFHEIAWSLRSSQ